MKNFRDFQLKTLIVLALISGMGIVGCQNKKQSLKKQDLVEEGELPTKDTKESETQKNSDATSKRIVKTEANSVGEYTGEFENRKYHGEGTFIWKNGAKYIGSFKNGKRSGKGTYTWKNYAYVGEYEDDKRNGKGNFIWEGGEYDGEFKDSNFHGKGTIKNDLGITFTGEFIEGKTQNSSFGKKKVPKIESTLSNFVFEFTVDIGSKGFAKLKNNSNFRQGGRYRSGWEIIDATDTYYGEEEYKDTLTDNLANLLLINKDNIKVDSCRFTTRNSLYIKVLVDGDLGTEIVEVCRDFCFKEVKNLLGDLKFVKQEEEKLELSQRRDLIITGAKGSVTFQLSLSVLPNAKVTVKKKSGFFEGTSSADGLFSGDISLEREESEVFIMIERNNNKEYKKFNVYSSDLTDISQEVYNSVVLKKEVNSKGSNNKQTNLNLPSFYDYKKEKLNGIPSTNSLGAFTHSCKFLVHV